MNYPIPTGHDLGVVYTITNDRKSYFAEDSLYPARDTIISCPLSTVACTTKSPVLVLSPQRVPTFGDKVREIKKEQN